jgi:hypothetical protein
LEEHTASIFRVEVGVLGSGWFMWVRKSESGGLAKESQRMRKGRQGRAKNMEQEGMTGLGQNE